MRIISVVPVITVCMTVAVSSAQMASSTTDGVALRLVVEGKALLAQNEFK